MRAAEAHLEHAVGQACGAAARRRKRTLRQLKSAVVDRVGSEVPVVQLQEAVALRQAQLPGHAAQPRAQRRQQLRRERNHRLEAAALLQLQR